jgi:hypothetical protein
MGDFFGDVLKNILKVVFVVLTIAAIFGAVTWFTAGRTAEGWGSLIFALVTGSIAGAIGKRS